MKNILTVMFLAAMLLTACDDNTDTLGSSLTNAEDVLKVADGTFNITSRSVKVDSVLTRNIGGFLGQVKDPESWDYVTSDFITQFHTFENYNFPDKETLAEGIKAEYCEVRLYYQSFYGDSLATMKATIYEMDRPIEEGAIYYNTFDPVEKGFVRTGDGAIKQPVSFSMVNYNYSDSARNASNYVPNIRFMLDQPYIDKKGRHFDNYGSYVMQMYYDNPENFKNSYNFIHNVCPGFYIKMENGVGAMANIYLTQLNISFTYNNSDKKKLFAIANFSGTEEVRQITRVTCDQDHLKALSEDKTCTYLKTPAGIFTELTLPVEEIFKGHETDSINSARITLPCYKSAESKYTFKPASTILMLEADSLQHFFEDNKVVNYRSSFIADYSESSNSYMFGNISLLTEKMYRQLPTNPAEREKWKLEHPNWNKVLLIPVNVTYSPFSSARALSSVSHDMSLSSVRLVGGSQNTQGDIKVDVIYSKFER